MAISLQIAVKERPNGRAKNQTYTITQDVKDNHLNPGFISLSINRISVIERSKTSNRSDVLKEGPSSLS